MKLFVMCIFSLFFLIATTSIEEKENYSENQENMKIFLSNFLESEVFEKHKMKELSFLVQIFKIIAVFALNKFFCIAFCESK